MLNIEVKDEKCVGCYLCVEACPADVLGFDNAILRPTVVAIENCLVCRSCEFACKSKAILVQMPEWQSIPSDRLVEFA